MMKNKRIKLMSLAMAAALAITPMVGSTAMAALPVWNVSRTSTTDLTWQRPNTAEWQNRTISSVSSSDKTVMVDPTPISNQFTIAPLKAGTTTLTISYYTTDISNTTTETQVVTVTDATSAVTFSAVNQDQVPITQTFTGLGTIVSQNTNVATVSINVAGQLVVRSVGPGSTKIVGVGTMVGGSSYTVSLDVTVNGTAAATTNGVVVNGNNITIPKGQTYSVPGTYYTISAISSNPAVATAIQTGSTGAMTLPIVGVSAGTTTVSGTRYSAATSAAESFAYTITVTDGTTTTTTTGAVTGATGTPLSPMPLNVGQTQGTNAANGSAFVEIDAASIQSVNSAVATAKTSGTRINVTGVSAGTTAINFKARLVAGGAWIDYNIPVTVTGTSTTVTETTTTTDSETVANAITFKKTSYTLPKSTKGAYVLKGMQLEGNDVDADELYWVSNDTSVVIINSQTGAFKVITDSGSATVIAVDGEGKSIGTVLIKAK